MRSNTDKTANSHIYCMKPDKKINEKDLKRKQINTKNTKKTVPTSMKAVWKLSSRDRKTNIISLIHSFRECFYCDILQSSVE